MKTQVLTENGLNIYDQEIKTYINNNKVQADWNTTDTALNSYIKNKLNQREIS